ncbi:uncharacterized protein SCHCODRAFT_02746390 [Schizophyllum commune H4-8]|uniref:F-box domain-containing protein n=1 Tax=Schizophyllum commune (strain H4-8 / FGSC 9210) TaxID=578458 RepID=D8Q3L0_SCHCM|nr:uncharacterized protein SCHCODRAFT_02746390 [Schizophyllum commune H4-8]KAI5894947.1 hypothetical protein SCHCODRAFT_02746390 [Schizophyllum commune H4-8]
MASRRSSSRVKALAEKKATAGPTNTNAVSSRRTARSKNKGATASGASATKPKGRSNKKRKITETSGTEEEPDAPEALEAQPTTLGIKDMPPEIFDEILMQCRPDVLLSISRANKYLHNTLFSRDSERIWQQSFENYQDVIPAWCPAVRDSITVIEYATILFGRTCSICKSFKGKHLLAAFVTRVCSECLKRDYISIEPYPGERSYNDRQASYGVHTDIAKMPGSENVSVIAERALHAKIIPILQGMPPEMVAEYQEGLRRTNTVKTQFRLEVEEFFANERRQKAAETRRLSKEMHDGRRAFIYDRLKAAGLGDQLASLEKLQPKFLNTFVNRPTPITPEVWKEMEPEVVQHIADLIAEHEKETAVRVFGERVKELTTKMGSGVLDGIFPKLHWSELAVEEPIRGILLEGVQYAHPSRFPDVDDKEFVALAKRCSERKMEYLRGLLPLSNDDTNTTPEANATSETKRDTDAALHLATTYFKCTLCDSEPMPFARVVGHHCQRVVKSSKKDDKDDKKDISFGALMRSKRSHEPFYKTDTVILDAQAGAHAELLIKACDKDPKKTSFAEMEAHHARFECRLPVCHSRTDGTRTARRWRNALIHSYNVHPENAKTGLQTTPRWTVIDDADTMKRIGRVEIEYQSHKGCRDGCTTKLVSDSDMPFHMALVHGTSPYLLDRTMDTHPTYVRFV